MMFFHCHVRLSEGSLYPSHLLADLPASRCSHLSADMGGYGKASGKGAKGPKGGKGKGKARMGAAVMGW